MGARQQKWTNKAKCDVQPQQTKLNLDLWPVTRAKLKFIQFISPLITENLNCSLFMLHWFGWVELFWGFCCFNIISVSLGSMKYMYLPVISEIAVSIPGIKPPTHCTTSLTTDCTTIAPYMCMLPWIGVILGLAWLAHTCCPWPTSVAFVVCQWSRSKCTRCQNLCPSYNFSLITWTIDTCTLHKVNCL